MINSFDLNNKPFEFQSEPEPIPHQHNATLTKAITPLCLKMCPSKEITERTMGHRLNFFECNASTRKNWQNCSKNNMEAAPDLMVKAFRRSDAGHKMTPEMIRPHHVLLGSAYHLLANVLNHPKMSFQYKNEFITDRLRAVRQDLIVLHDNKSPAFVEILEKTAKFHILAMYWLCEKNLQHYDSGLNGQYLNATMCNLVSAYGDSPGRFRNEAKFRALAILLMAHAWDPHEFKSFRPKLKESAKIRLAVSVFNSLKKRDAKKFFTLLRTKCGFFEVCCLHQYFPLMRHEFLKKKPSDAELTVKEFCYVCLFDSEKSAELFAAENGAKMVKRGVETVVDAKELAPLGEKFSPRKKPSRFWTNTERSKNFVDLFLLKFSASELVLGGEKANEDSLVDALKDFLGKEPPYKESNAKMRLCFGEDLMCDLLGDNDLKSKSTVTSNFTVGKTQSAPKEPFSLNRSFSKNFPNILKTPRTKQKSQFENIFPNWTNQSQLKPKAAKTNTSNPIKFSQNGLNITKPQNLARPTPFSFPPKFSPENSREKSPPSKILTNLPFMTKTPKMKNLAPESIQIEKKALNQKMSHNSNRKTKKIAKSNRKKKQQQRKRKKLLKSCRKAFLKGFSQICAQFAHYFGTKNSAKSVEMCVSTELGAESDFADGSAGTYRKILHFLLPKKFVAISKSKTTGIALKAEFSRNKSALSNFFFLLIPMLSKINSDSAKTLAEGLIERIASRFERSDSIREINVSVVVLYSHCIKQKKKTIKLSEYLTEGIRRHFSDLFEIKMTLVFAPMYKNPKKQQLLELTKLLLEALQPLVKTHFVEFYKTKVTLSESKQIIRGFFHKEVCLEMSKAISESMALKGSKITTKTLLKERIGHQNKSLQNLATTAFRLWEKRPLKELNSKKLAKIELIFSQNLAKKRINTKTFYFSTKSKKRKPFRKFLKRALKANSSEKSQFSEKLVKMVNLFSFRLCERDKFDFVALVDSFECLLKSLLRSGLFKKEQVESDWNSSIKSISKIMSLDNYSLITHMGQFSTTKVPQKSLFPLVSILAKNRLPFSLATDLLTLQNASSEREKTRLLCGLSERESQQLRYLRLNLVFLDVFSFVSNYLSCCFSALLRDLGCSGHILKRLDETKLGHEDHLSELRREIAGLFSEFLKTDCLSPPYFSVAFRQFGLL